MKSTVQLTMDSESKDCGIIVYDSSATKIVDRIPFTEGNRIGHCYQTSVTFDENQLYQFYEEDRVFADPMGKAFLCNRKYGEVKEASDYFTMHEKKVQKCCKSLLAEDSFPQIPYEDSLIYCMHVRGFTAHSSSKVKKRGTFLGILEKIDYLKSIGVTTLELQPVIEYPERSHREENGDQHQTDMLRNPLDLSRPPEEQLNYWGYTKGYYYAPKAAYACSNPAEEFAEMVRALHVEKIEVVLQFYFPSDFCPFEIPKILHYWVETYHVDGFHLIGEGLPTKWLARDPFLANTKLWYYAMDTEEIYGHRALPKHRRLGLLREDYLYDVRRFLRGDENCVSAMIHHIRTNPAACARIHYLTTYWGFTLMDMVSYNCKHNEANGEGNRDGTDYNCSWNCGEEGPSRKKKIVALRKRQMVNAYALLLLTQSAPRIFMGDEFGNTQFGNNNPYCQDNLTTWLNWKDAEKNNDLFESFRTLLKFRMSHPMLHPANESLLTDSNSCGYPEISFHGRYAWKPQTEGYSRLLGVLFCDGNSFVYLAMNMHSEERSIALPRLPKERSWVDALTGEKIQVLEDGTIPISPRTIEILEGKTTK